MTNYVKRRDWISRIYLTAACAAPMLAIALALGVAATPPAQAKSYKLLYSFGGPENGWSPQTGVVMDAAGNLYGTTNNGGPSYFGNVFKLDTSGNETVLYNFTDGSDGAYPSGSLWDAGESLFYGTTDRGGAGGCDCGTVFTVDTAGNLTTLHTFAGYPNDGSNPYGGLIQDANGNLYGSTLSGGSFGGGTVFEIDKTGVESVLYSFCSRTNCTDGWQPNGVTWGNDGNLYGVATVGGNESIHCDAGCGVVFAVTTAGVETVLYSFKGGRGDGGHPDGRVVRDHQGNLYGATSLGGHSDSGTIFKVSPDGTETKLHRFTDGSDGGIPLGSLVQDKKSNLYGVTSEGGTSNRGVLFKLGPGGKETVLHNFSGGAEDGAEPAAPVLRDDKGDLYGTTSEGGNGSCTESGCGTVWKLTP